MPGFAVSRSSKNMVPFLLLLLAHGVLANNALNVNTFTQNNKTAQIHLTTWGSDFYFAVMAVMAATGLAILLASFTELRSDRLFFYLTGGLCMVASIAYFSMGSNLGWTPIDVEWRRNRNGLNGINRQVFYVRYIDWFITTPLLLLDLCLTARFPWPTILWIIALDEVMIVMGLVGALVRTRYKWGFYVFGLAAMLALFYELAVVGRSRVKRLGRDISRVYMMCGVLTLFIWCLYPIAWGLCEGGNVITPSSEAVFYGVLDLLAKPLFSIMLIMGHWRIDPARLGLQFRDFEEVTPGEQKHQHHHHDNGAHTANVAAATIDPNRPHMA